LIHSLLVMSLLINDLSTKNKKEKSVYKLLQSHKNWFVYFSKEREKCVQITPISKELVSLFFKRKRKIYNYSKVTIIDFFIL